jgi:hypothetical protein
MIARLEHARQVFQDGAARIDQYDTHGCCFD